MKRAWLCLVFMYCVVLACSFQPFEREVELYSLLNDLCENCQPENGFLFIMIEEGCASCQEEVREKLKLEAMNSIHNIVIISTDSTIIRHNNRSKNVRLVYCPLSKIQAKGISQVSSLVFVFKRNKMVEWGYLNDETIDKIIKRL